MGFFSELGFFLANGKTKAQHDEEGRKYREKWRKEDEINRAKYWREFQESPAYHDEMKRRQNGWGG